MRYVAISMVSWRRILVKRLVNRKKQEFLERCAFLIWETKEKVSLE